MDIKKLTIKSTLEGYAKKDFSPEELRREFLKLIEKENPVLNAYLEVFSEGVLPLLTPTVLNNNFRAVGDPQSGHPLLGIPCAIKDNILIDGTRCTAGSRILEDYVSAYDATAIKKLRDSGTVFLGKTNLDEFAMGSSTENSAFGPTKNPHDLTRVPGGTSGGSAAAVAAGLAVFALGSDMGGSIRQPSSLCGVVGLRTTYGRVSRHGLISVAPSLDQIGPITKNVFDSALVLNSIGGQDRFDSNTSPDRVRDYTQNLSKSIKGLRVGVPKEYFGEGLDPEVEKTVNKAISKLQSLGAEPVDISLPHSEYALAAYYIIMTSEASANLARYDGIKYGLSSKAGDLLNTYLKTREEGFGEEVRRRIMLGTYALSAGYYDAYYKKALEVRTLIKKDFGEAFKKVDVIVGPTSPTVAFKLGEKTDDPLTMYLSDVYTVAINLAGIPALSIPCGSVDNLPVGLQIVGRHFDEEGILRVAYNFENNS